MNNQNGNSAQVIQPGNADSYTIKEILYYAYFAVMLVAKGLGLYSGQWPYTVALSLGAVLIIIKLILTEHSLLEWCGIIALAALSYAIYVHSDEFGIFILLATIVGMKGVKPERVMKLSLVLWSLTFSLSMLLALTGLRGDIFRAQDKLGLGYILRWSLGQPHPNVLQISTILLCVFILYLGRYKGKQLLWVTFLLLLMNVYIFVYSLSFTGIIIAIFYLGFNLYMSFRGEHQFAVWEKAAAFLVLPFCLFFSVLGPVLIKGRLWELINRALNTRFYIAKMYMSFNPVSLFGSGYCNELSHDLNNLDCSYVFALMHYGIIFFVLFFGLYYGMIIRYVKENKRLELSFVLAFLVAAVTEPFLVNSSFKNISLVFLGEYIFSLTAGSRMTLMDITGKSMGLTALGDKEIILPTDKLRMVWDKYLFSIKKRWKILLSAGLLVGILGAVIFAFTADFPTAYYMNRDSVQVNGEHGFTIDRDNLPEDFDGTFLEYTDKDTLMMRLDGNAVRVECVRGIMSMLVWGTLLTVMVLNVIFVILDKKLGNQYEC